MSDEEKVVLKGEEMTIEEAREKIQDGVDPVLRAIMDALGIDEDEMLNRFIKGKKRLAKMLDEVEVFGKAHEDEMEVLLKDQMDMIGVLQAQEIGAFEGIRNWKGFDSVATFMLMIGYYLGRTYTEVAK